MKPLINFQNQQGTAKYREIPYKIGRREALALSYPICIIFMAKKSVDKSGCIEKSECDKSEDLLYLVFTGCS